MKVQFSRIDEFLEEVTRDAAYIDRKIVRVTIRWRSGMPMTTYSLLATALVRAISREIPDPQPQLLMLERRLGEVFGELTEPQKKGIDKVVGDLTAELKKLGLEVRAGALEEGE